MFEEKQNTVMESVSKKMFRSSGSSSLFVPRATVIRHTKEFILQNGNSIPCTPSKPSVFEMNHRGSKERENVNKHLVKKDEKDSGIDDSFDDDGGTTSDSYDSDQSQKRSSSDDSYQHEPPPLKYVPPSPVATAPQGIFQRINEDRKIDEKPKHGEHADFMYIPCTYQYADHRGLLKNTLFKLIRNSAFVGRGRRKEATRPYLKPSFNGDNETKVINSLVDFSISSTSESKNYHKPSPAHASPTLEACTNNNPLRPMPRLEYAYESLVPSSTRSNGTYIPIRPPPLLKRSIGEQIAVPFENSLQCEYCHKKFNNEDAAKRHLLTHKGKRTHKCTHCSRSFYEQSSYLRHLKSHSGEKAHKCEQCSMAFSKRSALEVHIRTHTGERPFVCKYCGKGFSISGNLHRHVLIHTGHRPYKCGKCPRAFNNPSHLARHISSFHA